MNRPPRKYETLAKWEEYLNDLPPNTPVTALDMARVLRLVRRSIDRAYSEAQSASTAGRVAIEVSQGLYS